MQNVCRLLCVIFTCRHNVIVHVFCQKHKQIMLCCILKMMGSNNIRASFVYLTTGGGFQTHHGSLTLVSELYITPKCIRCDTMVILLFCANNFVRNGVSLHY
ncbi:hypothetical protein NP493_16g05039 [Ridgeia piscesae]|uniref:Uncharacterized protein n=1 Tax=Ridgeia piscesae TaxID=27915 RepID=A0AAD9PEI8_RIDPI|nr:hypothetical protein NP493_16g05039 [Ridgeia piscesae]